LSLALLSTNPTDIIRHKLYITKGCNLHIVIKLTADLMFTQFFLDHV